MRFDQSGQQEESQLSRQGPKQPPPESPTSGPSPKKNVAAGTATQTPPKKTKVVPKKAVVATRAKAKEDAVLIGLAEKAGRGAPG